MYKKWILPETDRGLAQELAEECGIDPFVALILLSRGYSDPYEIEEFLSDEIVIGDPYELAEMYEAVNRINIALENNEIIAIFGDYDCDGITSTVLLVEYFKNRNAKVIYKIPDREQDGYGMNIRQIDEIADEGATLIITVDNGINSIDEIEYANSLQIDTVVTDHHLPKGERPNAVAVVDPHNNPDGIFKNLAGVGVAFKLVCALEHKAPEEMLAYFGDLVAIGTVADIMPLVYDNRSFVKFGLEVLNKRRRTGVSALLSQAGCYSKPVDTGVISFQIAPRVNSAGRINNAEMSVKLLTEKDYNNATEYAKIVNEYNIARQDIEKEIFSAADEIINQNKYYYDRVIVVDGYNWHHGVIGIVASRIVEKYGKPAIVLSTDGTEVMGSGRSIKGFSLFNALSYASEYTIRFGGHELAAGVGLEHEKISGFRAAVNQYAKSSEPGFPSLRLDCKLNPKALSLDIVNALETLEPFGVGNPKSVFGIFNVKISKITPIGKGGKHLRLTFSREGCFFESLMFGVTPSEFEYNLGDIVNIAVSLDRNVYNDNESLSVFVKDIRPALLDEQQYESGIINYEMLKRHEPEFNAKILFPNRSEVGMVFKYLKEHPNGVLKPKLCNSLLRFLPIGKIYCALDTLCELGLAVLEQTEQGEFVSAVNSTQKTNLENSELYKLLKQKAGEE